MKHNTQVLVLGGGPGGYVAAIRCAQLGLDTILVEANDLGGTCLNRGCIPSKALIHVAEQYQLVARIAESGNVGITLDSPPHLDLRAAMTWKDSVVTRLNAGVVTLLQRAKVQVLRGHGVLTDAKTCRVTNDDGEHSISAEHVILATGSVPVELPHLPFGGRVISSTNALSLTTLPEKLLVVGAGYIGLELGMAFAKLGCAVTVVESQDRILPNYDERLTEPVRRSLDRLRVTVHLSSHAEAVTADGLQIRDSHGARVQLQADYVVVAVGRRALTTGWGRENAAIELDGPFVRTDERCATSTRNVWAIGDLVGEPMLAHKASAQGERVAEIIAGQRRRFDPMVIPAVCFTDPEIVTVGAGPDAPGTLSSIFPFAANGRALSMEAGNDGGFVRIIARRDDHRILGVQAVGKQVSELSNAFVQGIEGGWVLEDVADVVHAHPTLGEAFHEAALRALGHAIHV